MNKIATFAAGCFWGVEETFRTLPGVLETSVGYTGGNTENPTYRDVCNHGTGHAEAVQVTFDPDKIKYTQLLEVFFANHNPTSLNYQGPDTGDQYRSEIFYHNEEQKQEAENTKTKLEESKKFKNPIVTKVTPATKFYIAEEYHQKYLMNKGLSSCHI